MPTLMIYYVCCHQYKGPLQHRLYPKESLDDPHYLPSHLRNLYYFRFQGLDDEIEFVKYILKEARVLETADLILQDKKLKESVLKKLVTFPRCSQTCLLAVE